MCALVLRILRGNYPPVDAARYSPQLRAMVDWMLQLEPGARPTMEQIVNTELVQVRG